MINIRRCSWCNGYRRRKWTRQHEFKSWTRLIAFHIALIPLGKVWIQLFSLQLWVNSRTDWVLQPWWGNYSRRRNTLNSKTVKLCLRIDLVSYPAWAEGLVNMINTRRWLWGVLIDMLWIMLVLLLEYITPLLSMSLKIQDMIKTLRPKL